MEPESVFGEGTRDPRVVREETFRRFSERAFADRAVREAVSLVLEEHRRKGNLVAFLQDGQVRVERVG